MKPPGNLLLHRITSSESVNLGLDGINMNGKKTGIFATRVKGVGKSRLVGDDENGRKVIIPHNNTVRGC